MKLNIFKFILIITFGILSACVQTKETSDSSSSIATEFKTRMPAYSLSCSRCKKMDILAQELATAKERYEPFMIAEDVPDEERPEPTSEEQNFSDATYSVSNYISDFKINSGDQEENEIFLRFVVDIVETMGKDGGMAKVETAQYFYDQYKKHKRILQPIAKRLKLTKKINSILKMGKPETSGDHQ